MYNNYEHKYLKYKKKYELRKIQGGAGEPAIDNESLRLDEMILTYNKLINNYYDEHGDYGDTLKPFLPEVNGF